MRKMILNLLKLYKLGSVLAWNQKPANIIYSTCKFYPTCSEYTEEAVKKYGAGKGLFMGIKRLSRCNPLSRGGYDPVK